ncbi:hypothetical protein Ciccas_005000 [Cichlidogyrus casuarinus]|uniref:XK-related protein n=1 Tax=Cichlidogyrus casuarinus TaxID=1844966 RepID=A0ABD2Q9Z5_9PLAT
MLDGDQQESDEALRTREMEQFIKQHGLRWFTPIIFLFSLAAYVFDVTSDCYLVYAYFIQGDYYWSILTLVFTIIPSIIMTTFSLAWYVLDHRNNRDPPRSCLAWTLRIFLHMLQLSPLVRTFDAIIYGFKSINKELSIETRYEYVRLMQYEDSDSAILRLIESFTEAAPQLMLQLYIQFTQPFPEKITTRMAQLISILCSWLSLAYCLSAYQTSLRNSLTNKSKMTFLSSLTYTLWKAGILASRILSLALFAAAFRGIFLTSALFVHWLICLLILIKGGTTFCSTDPRNPAEILFDLVLAAIYIFDVVNVREGHSRIWFAIFYSLMFIENMIFSMMWYFRYTIEYVKTGLGDLIDYDAAQQGNITQPPGILRLVPREAVLSFSLLSFLFGLCFMGIYYLFAHPSGKIRLYVPCEELCQDLSGEPHSRQASHSYEITEPCSPDSAKIPLTCLRPGPWDDYKSLNYIDAQSADQDTSAANRNHSRHLDIL